jgi:hypothetical protein
MGEWGTGVFKNDYAHDLAADVRDAPDPNVYLEEFLAVFIDETRDGYDGSTHAEEWPPAMRAAAACELVRLGAPNPSVEPERVPLWLPGWLSASKFVSSRRARELAKKTCDVLTASSWLQGSYPNAFQEIVQGVSSRVSEMG